MSKRGKVSPLVPREEDDRNSPTLSNVSRSLTPCTRPAVEKTSQIELHTFSESPKKNVINVAEAATDQVEMLETNEDCEQNLMGQESCDVSPVIESQMRLLRQRFIERTESIRRRTLLPPTPDDSSDDDSVIVEPCDMTEEVVKEATKEPHELNTELAELVQSHINGMRLTKCCARPTCCASEPFRKTIAPQSHTYLIWLSLVTLAYIYNVTSIILRSAFTIYYTSDNYHVWLTLDYLCDLIYIIDLAVIKSRVQFIHNGLLEANPVETRKNYLRSLDFKLDVASLLPLDVFYSVVGIYGSAQSLLRLPRYLKLKSAWEFFDRFDQIAKSGHVVRVARTMTYMLFLIHVETCGYYAISVYEGIGTNRWVYDGNGFAYIRCFYLATKTATSIGNNPKPTNQLEYLFMTVYWLSGVFVFALLLGQIRDIFESANSVKTTYQKAQDSTLQYLQNMDVPQEMQLKVRDWFNYNWDQHKTLSHSKWKHPTLYKTRLYDDESKFYNDENLLVDVLPTKMKTDLFINVHYATLSKVSLFQNCEKALLADLVLKLKPVIVQPGDYICRIGEVGSEMYIIMHGEVEVVTNEGQILTALGAGSVFGEISLMGLSGGNRRTANVRSCGYSNLFILSKHDFEEAMEDYPQAHALLRRRAHKLLKRTPGQQKKSKESEETDEVEQTEDAKSVEIMPARAKTPKMYQTALQVVARHGSRIRAWLRGNPPPDMEKSDSSTMLMKSILKMDLDQGEKLSEPATSGIGGHPQISDDEQEDTQRKKSSHTSPCTETAKIGKTEMNDHQVCMPPPGCIIGQDETSTDSPHRVATPKLRK